MATALFFALVLFALLAGVRLAAAQASEPYFTPGAVFGMSNDRDGNEVVAFNHGVDGRLGPAGTFETGGTGSDTVEDSANGLVLANVSRESSSNKLQGTPRFLLATPLNKALPITNKQGAKPYSDTQRTRKEAGISATGLFPGTALPSMLRSSEW